MIGLIYVCMHDNLMPRTQQAVSTRSCQFLCLELLLSFLAFQFIFIDKYLCQNMSSYRRQVNTATTLQQPATAPRTPQVTPPVQTTTTTTTTTTSSNISATTQVQKSTGPQTQVSEPRKWLGKNPEVVCFLIALEHDRLFKENEQLKVVIKELGQGGDDRYNKLQAKYDDAQKEIANLRSQLEQWNSKYESLNSRYSSMEQELNEYKSRLNNVDNSLAGRLQDAERKYKSLKSLFLKELRISFINRWLQTKHQRLGEQVQ